MHKGKGFVSEYEKSKAVADNVALEAAKEGVPIVACYPGIIYGPGKVSAGNVVAQLLVERFNGRSPGYIGPGKETFSFSHVDDVVDGHISAIKNGRPGERYLLTGENASFTDLFNKAAAMTNTKKPKFKVPLRLILAVGWSSVFYAKLTGKKPFMTPETVYALRHKWSYSCEKAKRELNYKPRTLNEGLEEVLPWLKELGEIKY